MLMLCSIVFCDSSSFATPPTSIDLSYDLTKGMLHVEAVHPSFDLDKSYVRLMNVYVNGDQVSTLNYFRQTDNKEFIDDVPLTAQVGDVIKVDLFCSLGGEMAQELTVTKTAATPPQQGTSADSTSSTSNNTVY